MRKVIAARVNLQKAMEANRAKYRFPAWRCAMCGIEQPATVHQRRKTYCSRACSSKAQETTLLGAANPNYRNAGQRMCSGCGKHFHSYNKTRKFCSLECYRPWSIGPSEAKKLAARERKLKYKTRKDGNHDIVFDELEKHIAVLDMSNAGRGLPDGLACINGLLYLFDVKNPATPYGRSGLNDVQRKWIAKMRGPKVWLLYTADEAWRFAHGQFGGLKYEDDTGLHIEPIAALATIPEQARNA